MALFGIIFLVVALVLVGIGLTIGIFFILATAGFLALGILSASVFVAFRTGRPSTAVRVFLVLSGVAVGVPAGTICAWALTFWFEAYAGDWLVLVYGALAGAVVGVMFSLLVERVARCFYNWAVTHFMRAPARS